MKKIAIITSHAPSLTSFRAPLIRTLTARGVQVFALAPNFNEKVRKDVCDLGATPIDCSMDRVGMNPLKDIFHTVRLVCLLSRLRPDCSLGYFIKPVIFGCLAAWLARVPHRFSMVEGLGFVFTASQDENSLKRRVLKKLVLWMYKLGLSRAERVIFLNPDDRDELVSAGALTRSKSFLLGGIGVDLDQWAYVPPVDNPVTFTMVARLLREKGVEEYFAAARILKGRYPLTRFILLGGVDENPGAITTADVQAWVSEGVVEWKGHTSVKPWLEKTSVFVLPSYREGVPASTQEAMAIGRAVVTTDVPGCRETVVDGFNGFLVPARDASALAEKMEQFIQYPKLIETMGLASRRLAEERFNADKVNDRLISLLSG